MNHDYWFDLPNMGTLVVNAYDCVFVCLAPNHISTTYLPWWTCPIPGRVQTMTIAHICFFSHYVPVQLHERAPLPPIVPGWDMVTQDVARPWHTFVEGRLGD